MVEEWLVQASDEVAVDGRENLDLHFFVEPEEELVEGFELIPSEPFLHILFCSLFE
jgi:hypothetical protein